MNMLPLFLMALLLAMLNLLLTLGAMYLMLWFLDLYLGEFPQTKLPLSLENLAQDKVSFVSQSSVIFSIATLMLGLFTLKLSLPLISR